MIGCMCFNSRTCEGATRAYINQHLTSDVSIHAPVKVRRLINTGAKAIARFQFTHL